MITILQHNKNEWSRMAQDAYAKGRDDFGQMFNSAASARTGAQIAVHQFDQLQSLYRAWLVFGWEEVDRLIGRAARLKGEAA